ncbi:hypothetical protein ABEW00_15755 [Rossellomorea vietnamensis]|uniref:hypothetical protein n=1 Tax=Rossellomorea vietnamensis TaxID=218284 RepID=UPI003D28299F
MVSLSRKLWKIALFWCKITLTLNVEKGSQIEEDFFSLVSALLMCLSLFGFTDILSSTLSWNTVLLAAVPSLILNGFLVGVWLLQGSFYKSGLYPSAFYQVIFILIIGIVVIGAADKPYVVDAWDGVSLYVTLLLVSLIHGLILMWMVKGNKVLV